jgi:hypothetical protein
MPRSADSGYFDLAEHLHRLQLDLSARLYTVRQIEHASASGAAAENLWIAFLNAHLPERFRVTPAFVLHPSGRRSRQIDAAIYDTHLAAPLFPNSSAIHLPVDSVRAVFEIKPTFSRQWLTDASHKAQSVQSLTRRKIPAGLLARSSVWTAKTFRVNLLRSLPDNLQLGCALDHGAFCASSVSAAPHALGFFLAHLLTFLNPRLKRYFSAVSPK